VKILGKEVPISELRANLKKVAEDRELLGANLELHFRPDVERKKQYYNIYRYAFFGKVPEVELDPRAKTISLTDIGKAKLFTEKRK